MNFLNFDIKKAIAFVLLAALPLISINTQQNPLTTGWYNKPFTFMAGLAQTLFYDFSDGVRSTTGLYLNLIDIKKNNQQLQSTNLELMARLEVMEELKKENERLNALLEFKSQSKMELIAAKIMSRDLNSEHNTIRINKGTKHGLKSGQAVVTIGGVVGYVFRPETNTTQVLLITDRYSVVDGLVARSRARGIVEGKGGAECTLKYVEKSEDVKVGDTIISSGLDNILPKGFPIATVEAVENKAFSVSLKVDLKPVVDPDKIEEVFIILNAANEDFEQKISMRTEDATDTN